MLIAQTTPPAGGTAAKPAAAPAAVPAAAPSVAPAAAPAAAPDAAPAATPAAAATAAPAAETFSKEQLEQLVAPIALYADACLMQILMAATYPLEIVEADRCMSANKPTSRTPSSRRR